MSELTNKSLGKSFRLKVVNTTGDDKVMAFFGGYISTTGQTITQAGVDPFAVSAIVEHQHNIAGLNAAGVTVDHVADDGILEPNFVCTPMESKNKIRDFREYVKHTPLVLMSLTITADNKSYFDESLVWGILSPLIKQNQEQAQQLEPFFNTFQSQDNKIVINFEGGLIIDHHRLMYGNIPNGRTITYTFNFQ